MIFLIHRWYVCCMCFLISSWTLSDECSLTCIAPIKTEYSYSRCKSWTITCTCGSNVEWYPIRVIRTWNEHTLSTRSVHVPFESDSWWTTPTCMQDPSSHMDCRMMISIYCFYWCSLRFHSWIRKFNGKTGNPHAMPVCFVASEVTPINCIFASFIYILLIIWQSSLQLTSTQVTRRTVEQSVHATWQVESLIKQLPSPVSCAIKVVIR
jgi:hypothetical protein